MSVSVLIGLGVAMVAILGGSLTVCDPSYCTSTSCPIPPHHEYCQALRSFRQQTRFRRDDNNHESTATATTTTTTTTTTATVDTDTSATAPTKKKRLKNNPIAKLFRKKKNKKKAKKTESNNGIAQYPNAFASDKQEPLSRTQMALIAELTDNLKETVPNFEKRAAAVPWNGPAGGYPWYNNDASLLTTYLKIMKWPTDLTAKFPFRLCPDGCKAQVAIAHTLEWREKYKPWCTSPAGMIENAKGFAYIRGHSPSLDNGGGHTLVWLRFPIHKAIDPVQWVRTVINVMDRAVADSLHRTNGKVGLFNAVVDGNGFALSHLVGMAPIKLLVTMLQDHFPDRLGVIVLANLARPAQFVVNMVKPLITKDVREKLYLLPDAAGPRQDMLEALVGTEFIPYYLGGTDEYRFSVEEYYDPKKHYCTDAESVEYIKTMPYHAN